MADKNIFCPLCGNKLVVLVQPHLEDMRGSLGFHIYKLVTVLLSLWKCESCEIVFEVHSCMIDEWVNKDYFLMKLKGKKPKMVP